MGGMCTPISIFSALRFLLLLKTSNLIKMKFLSFDGNIIFAKMLVERKRGCVQELHRRREPLIGEYFP